MLPVHPKVRALSDAAFRLYICAICWSSLNITDGHIPADQLRYLSDVRRVRQCADQLVQVGLWETADDGWRIHDYLEYQPSAEKVARERALKRQRQERWRAGGDASTDASPDPPVDASRDTSRDASSRARTHPIPSHGGSVGNHPADRNGRAADEMIRAVQQAMTKRTGRSVASEQAAAIAAQIVGSENVRNPVPYVTAAIERDLNPRRFLPASHPSARTPAEAALAAGITPNGRSADDKTIADIAAHARAAIRTRPEVTHDP
jgi:hypothetical protein